MFHVKTAQARQSCVELLFGDVYVSLGTEDTYTVPLALFLLLPKNAVLLSNGWPWLTIWEDERRACCAQMVLRAIVCVSVGVSYAHI